MSAGSGYFRGIVTGLLVGAATALLLAPRRGEELRQKLAEGASRLKEKAGGVTEDAIDRAGDFTVEVTDVTHDAANTLQDQKEDLQSRAHDVVDSV